MSDIHGGGTYPLTIEGRSYDLPQLSLGDLESLRNTLQTGLRAHVESIAVGLSGYERALLLRDGVPAYITRQFLRQFIFSPQGAELACKTALGKSGISPADLPSTVAKLTFDQAIEAALFVTFGERLEKTDDSSSKPA